MLPVLLIAFAFASCQKDNAIIQGTSSSRQTSPTSVAMMATVPGMITASAANPQNPYDAYGQLHNALLDNTSHVWTDSASTIGDVYDAMVATNIDTIDSPIPSKNDIVSLVGNLMNNDNSSYIISHSIISNEGVQLANSLFGILSNWKSFDSYVDFRDSVISLENTITNSSTLLQADKITLLKMASVLRFSMKFWVNYVYVNYVYSQPGSSQISPNSWFSKAWGSVKTFCKQHPVLTSTVLGDLGGITGGLAGAAVGSAVAFLTSELVA